MSGIYNGKWSPGPALVLTRKPGEFLRLTLPSGDTIFIAAEKYKSTQMRIFVTCDRAINVDRIGMTGEVQNKKGAPSLKGAK